VGGEKKTALWGKKKRRGKKPGRVGRERKTGGAHSGLCQRRGRKRFNLGHTREFSLVPSRNTRVRERIDGDL